MISKVKNSNENNEINNFLKTGNLSFLYLHKKCEKISSVLYILSSRIPDAEPLKFRLRDKALALVLECSPEALQKGSGFISIDVAGDPQRTAFAYAIGRIAADIQVLLQVAHAAGYISKMNVAVLVKELSDLFSFIRTTDESEILPEGPQISSGMFRSDDPNNRDEIKDNKEVDRYERKSKNVVSDTNVDLRKRLILNIILEKKVVTIKDISTRITNCSEKTIQRILATLVEDGTLQRQGSRRWSTYSIREQTQTVQSDSEVSIQG